MNNALHKIISVTLAICIVIVAFFVLGFVLDLFIKIAFFVVLVAAAYYLVSRAIGRGSRRDHDPFRRNR
jgi:membrane protein implicated in regulation of membrane protease activity